MKFKNKVALTELGFFILAVLLFIRVLFEPDYWWHIKVGEFIWQTKSIPFTDIFSFSLPNYQYVYHSWLSELFLYLIHSKAGLWGTTLFYALIGALSLWLMLKTIQLKIQQRWIYWYLLVIIPVILATSNLRVQILSLLCLSILYYVYKTWLLNDDSKLIWLIPILFMFWANLHAGFIVGLMLMISIFVIEMIKHGFKAWKSIGFWGEIKLVKTSRLLILSLVLVSSVIASLLNPYHTRIYQQAIQMGTNEFAATFNSDWYPIVRADEPERFVYAGLLITLVIMTLLIKSDLDIREKILLAAFFTLCLKNQRFTLPLTVILIPSLPLIFKDLSPNFNSILSKLYPINKLFVPFLLLIIISPMIIWIPRVNTAYKDDQQYVKLIRSLSDIDYPYEAVEYIKQHPLPEKFLNDYNWGGYISWKLPDTKIFIDGRMDNFFIDGESFAKQYVDMITIRSGWQELLEKYQIQAVFLDPKYPIVEMLRKLPEWELIYEDQTAVIFIKKEL